MSAPSWLGSPPSPCAIGATLFVGVTGILYAGVGPLLLGALAREGRLSAAQIGQAGTIELLTMGLAAGLTGIMSGPQRLRQLTVFSGMAIAMLDCVTLACNGWMLVMVRGLAGIPEGALIWLMTALIVRTPRPERWAAIYLTVQTLAQFVMVTALGVWVIGPFGANGAFIVMAITGVAAACAGVMVPPCFAALPVAADNPSGRPSPRGLTALAAAFCFNAAILAIWIYLEALSHQAGHPPRTGDTALSLSLAAQVVGGLLAVLLGGRMRYLPFLISSQVMMAGLMVVFTRLPGAVVFLTASTLFGGLWMFASPLLTPLAIDADPTRRAAILGSGAALLGCSSGPLLASLMVSDSDVRSSALVGCGLMAASIAIVLWLCITRRTIVPVAAS